jgi:hypothetical protein
MYLSTFGCANCPSASRRTPASRLPARPTRRRSTRCCIALRSGEGFIKITGEVGTGKTLLCRRFLATLGGRPSRPICPIPTCEPRTLMLALAEELGVELDKNADQYHLMKGSTGLLLEDAAERPVVSALTRPRPLPMESLESLRLLSNLETEKRKLLQLVLFGQPELDERLADPSVRQIAAADFLPLPPRRPDCPTRCLIPGPSPACRGLSRHGGTGTLPNEVRPLPPERARSAWQPLALALVGVLAVAGWLHFAGITPPASVPARPQPATETLSAAPVAKETPHSLVPAAGTVTVAPVPASVTPAAADQLRLDVTLSRLPVAPPPAPARKPIEAVAKEPMPAAAGKLPAPPKAAEPPAKIAPAEPQGASGGIEKRPRIPISAPFRAAVLQRLTFHREAVSEYQAALRMLPQAGVWWMGLGISLEAEGRLRRGARGLQRAKATGALSVELSASSSRNSRQLQPPQAAGSAPPPSFPPVRRHAASARARTRSASLRWS